MFENRFVDCDIFIDRLILKSLLKATKRHEPMGHLQHHEYHRRDVKLSLQLKSKKLWEKSQDLHVGLVTDPVKTATQAKAAPEYHHARLFHVFSAICPQSRWNPHEGQPPTDNKN